MAFETFGVRSAFTKEITVLLLCALITATATVATVLSMSSKNWVILSSKKPPLPAMPWLTFELGLLGGSATIHQPTYDHHVSTASIPFSYTRIGKYCPTTDGGNQCENLYAAGVSAIVLMSLSVAANFVAILAMIIVALQLSNVLASSGPLGRYVDYGKCQRNAVAAGLSSMLGAGFLVSGITAWTIIMARNETAPAGIDTVGWRPGWVWALLTISPLLMIGSTALTWMTANISRHPFTGYSSIS